MSRNIVARGADQRITEYVSTEETANVRELAYVGRFWDAIKAHRRVFLAVAIGFVVLTALVSIVIPREYTATAKLIVGGTPNEATSEEKATDLPVLNALALQRRGPRARTRLPNSSKKARSPTKSFRNSILT